MLKEYKNLHKNEPGFILASGPSLNRVYPEDMEGRNVIVVNDAFLRAYKAPYWLTHDPYILSVYENLRLQSRGLMANRIFCPARIVSERTEGMVVLNNTEIPNADELDRQKHYPVSFDLEEGYCDMNTPTHTALQLAAYMGMNPIFIHGADFCSYGGLTHFYGNRRGHKSYDLVNYPAMIQGMHDAAALLGQKGTKVYNTSRESKLIGLRFMELTDALRFYDKVA